LGDKTEELGSIWSLFLFLGALNSYSGQCTGLSSSAVLNVIIEPYFLQNFWPVTRKILSSFQGFLKKKTYISNICILQTFNIQFSLSLKIYFSGGKNYIYLSL
jgi:hypothetical protein